MAGRLDIKFVVENEKIIFTAVGRVALKHSKISPDSAEKTIRQYFADRGKGLLDGKYSLIAKVAPKLDIQIAEKETD